VETEDGVLVIRRIFVHHRVAASDNIRSLVEEVHNAYPMQCPLYRTLRRCIDFKTSYELVLTKDSGNSGGRRENSA
jgi:hypothetical protein